MSADYEIKFVANVSAETEEEAVDTARQLILDERYEPFSIAVLSS